MVKVIHNEAQAVHKILADVALYVDKLVLGLVVYVDQLGLQVGLVYHFESDAGYFLVYGGDRLPAIFQVVHF